MLEEKYTEEKETATVTSPGRQRGHSSALRYRPVAVARQLRKHFLERWEQQGWPRHYFRDAWSYRGAFHARAFYDSERWAWGGKRRVC